MQMKGLFSGNQLKVLAALLMVVDHVGVMLFPSVNVLRYIGRLSMPIFAFMIAEGCRYTKNKTKYFALIFALAVACQVAYAIFNPNDLYFSILITFSLSILAIFSLDHLKKCFFEKGKGWQEKTISTITFCLVIVGISLFNKFYKVDYGFWGCMLPAFASLLDFRKIDNDRLKKLDDLFYRKLCFAVGLIVLVFTSESLSLSIYALLSLPILFLYSGERGKLKMKYFFYIFYPLHLVVLEGIRVLL